MSLPQFAPFPDAQLRKNISPQEWELYLDSWASLAELYLRLNDQQFNPAVSPEESSLTSFLISFFHEAGHDDSIIPNAPVLRKRCFHLLHRIYSQNQVPPSLLKWTVLSDICLVYSKSEQFRTLLANLWHRKRAAIEKNFQLAKNSLIKNLESKMPESADDTLNKVVPLMKLSPDASTYMLTGSDFLDSLCTAYPRVPPSFQMKLTTTTYIGLVSLLEGAKPSFSLLSDHLYSLKASGEQQQKTGNIQQSLIADLVTNTPFLIKVRDKATAPEAARVRNFAASLSVFQQASRTRPKKLSRRKVDKGKAKAARETNAHENFGEIHVHRMSLITQIQDLFPDLGSGFVAKMLHEYNDNIEETTAHLLEDSLPPHLANADQSAQLPSSVAIKPHFTPRPTPPPPETTLPERRNAFDNDEFDRLAVDTSRLHLGRRNQQLTADRLLADRKNAPSKSTILSALAAFDSDDDERDDTYDVEDVGGTIDSTAPDDANLQDKNEEALFKAYSASPSLFSRDAGTRRSKERVALRNETGMSDEQIEGWGVMLGRDPRRFRKLEAKFSSFAGQQAELAPTSWRANMDSEGEGTGSGSGDGQRGGRGRGRGRGRGGRGGGGGGGRGRGGGNVAGPADDKATQAARQKKDQNKGSRANHNRRDQRARKIARGGGMAG